MLGQQQKDCTHIHLLVVQAMILRFLTPGNHSDQKKQWTVVME